MSRKFSTYSFFVPEFIEAQRLSFLQLLKTGIPTELQKHNPIELTISEKKKDTIKKKKLDSFVDINKQSSKKKSLALNDLHKINQGISGNGQISTFFSQNTNFENFNFENFKDYDEKVSDISISENFPLIRGSTRVRCYPVSKEDSLNLYLFKKYLTPHNYLFHALADFRQLNPMEQAKVNPLAQLDYTQNWPLVKTKSQTTVIKTSPQSEVKFRLNNLANTFLESRHDFSLSLKNKLKTNLREKFFIFFHVNGYKLIAPRETIQTAIFKLKTYSAPIYIPAELKTSSNQTLLSQWVLLGYLPLMTNRGHFIINGTARTVLHQLVRSPGVYFYKAKKDQTHYADVICHRGVWLRIEIDKKGLLWVRMKKYPKIPIPIFLEAFGLEHPHMFAQMQPRFFNKGDPDKESQVNTLARNIFQYSRQARFAFNLVVRDAYNRSKPGFVTRKEPRLNSKGAVDFLRQKFSFKTYDLSQIGRDRLNQKLGLKKSLKHAILTLDDLICITNYLIYVQNGQLPVDDIDHLKNRRVRSSGELILNQFGIGLINTVRLTRKKERQLEEIFKSDQIQKLVNTKPINGAFKEFFNSSPLSQFLDQTNALSEITHKRRLSSLGPGGITRDTAGMKIRGIHPSHYGRICPIETPEGPNAGLVNSLTTYARINENGFIETPFYKVKNGQLQNETQVFYLSADQDDKQAIAPSDLKKENFGFLKGNLFPVRFGSEFSKTTKENIDFMSVSRIQMISVATSLIPFLEHDDANRALMGSNMQRQSVPLLKPERAIVGTGLEGRVISDAGHSIQARESGLVTYASADKIQIVSFFKPKKSLSSDPSFLGYFQTKDTKKIFQKHKFHVNITTYPVNQFQRSNQNTCLTQRPLVKEGDWVEKGSCLVDCASSDLGELALGKNILIAYVPWEGYNFEDAILVSERLVFDDLFTSIHIVNHQTEIHETNNGPERITAEIFNDRFKSQLKNLDQNGIVRIGTWVTEGDILVRKVAPVVKQQLTPYQKFLYVILDKQIPTVKDTSLRVPKGLEGRIIDIKIRTKNEHSFNGKSSTQPLNATIQGEPHSVSIWIAEKKWLQVGDKMAGRHGNKGIVSQILPRQDMPYLPDGTAVDMVLNPLGVPSRMNVGQIFENLLGLAGKNLNQNYKVLPFDEVSGPEASRSLTFSKLYEAKKKTGKNWLFQPDNPGKMRIFDGRTGEPFDQPITVGCAYMLKLIHLVDEKIHARATGPYSLVTQQPLRGRSKLGGQRFGEMEVWALEGFGAAYTLQEILTIKSDDIYGRQQIMSYLFKDRPIQIGKPESFRVLIRELQALCLSIEIFDYPARDPETSWRRNPLDLSSDTFNLY